ncbi:hypothetical protein AWB79_07497 [Caballeronia hypogeia]|uniref:Uncharacterized protein n=2 Tax=Caballeronia hypogeia TaxID=1777140 RepID=A0A158DV88_9BURK|nr:hypothetical protein AWB79_07497 [Caballeronia hypogeia]
MTRDRALVEVAPIILASNDLCRDGTLTGGGRRRILNIPNACLKQAEASKERLAWKVCFNP